jgi:hypothetical protein
MYGWVWDHLSGTTARRVLAAAFLAFAAVFLLAVVVIPALRPVVTSTTGDGSGEDTDGVVEPDGVRQSPAPAATSASPTPVVPDDGGPQF